MKDYKIFVINPGSTSTKLSLFVNEENKYTCDVFHDSSVLKTFANINNQLNYRMQVVEQFIQDNQIDLSNFSKGTIIAKFCKRYSPCLNFSISP